MGSTSLFKFPILVAALNLASFQALTPLVLSSKDYMAKGTTEDEMAGWHHELDGHESE